ncbi:hypothetical protein [Mycobacterium sherrisii]|uniref:hypothetical protein n=1 Tax=Mycobacterium sherrisii TaxID=243061 RepID=UPI000A168544|nr:hypothetical protein [Mycobacterium sherrisii]MCV7029087.1 hypothetical protein [Mycobacterium sherrisii]ORW85403.1 hypothetical protein AWC25_23205 [Mycobacterium sherrisii]
MTSRNNTNNILPMRSDCIVNGQEWDEYRRRWAVALWNAVELGDCSQVSDVLRAIAATEHATDIVIAYLWMYDEDNPLATERT